MRIAWFTPFSRSSAIGKYSAIVLSEISRDHEVVIFAPDVENPSDSLPTSLPVKMIGGRGGKHDLICSLVEFDTVIYNLGNFVRFHLDILKTSRAYPGIVILHDLSLAAFFHEVYLNVDKDAAGWIKQMEFAHGQAGLALAEEIARGKRSPIGCNPAALHYHMARSAIHNSLGVVVHGNWARQQIAAVASMPVTQIDFPAPDSHCPPKPIHEETEGRKLRFLTIGMVNPNKLADRVIETIAASPRLRSEVTYSIAGKCLEAEYEAHLKTLITHHGLEDTVQLLGHQPESALEELLGNADALINLRNPHMGECSWSLLEGLFHAKPIVVWKHGYYDEFPSEIVKKVSSLEELRYALEALAANPKERWRMGKEAYSYAANRFTTQGYSNRFVAFVEVCRSNRPLFDLVDHLSHYVKEITGDKEDEYLTNLVGREMGHLLG